MAGESGSRIERILLLFVLAALAGALAFSEFARWRDKAAAEEEVDTLANDVAAARSEAEAALAAVIPPGKVAAANASVYLIVVNGAARGTAFVVDREHGVLAAAAHTADSLPIGEAGADIHILNRGTRHPIKVVGKQLHAGYGAFREIVEDYQPIRKNSSIYSPRAAPVRDLAFDAALIFVDPIDPETGENRLGPDLKLAPEEKLLALEPGEPIAVIGYPYDTLDDGFAPDAAVSRVERGVISAMIAPLDTAEDAEDPVVANLIIHRLSTAGGNSGSPVIDADGDVIGVHTHGIESISSNADGAAQRADVLYDLRSQEREKTRMQNIFLPAWRRRLAYWARAEDVLPWSFYMEYARPGEDPAPAVGDIDYAAPAPFVKEIRNLAFDPAAGSREAEAPDAPAGDDGAPRSFVIDDPGQYAEQWFAVDRGRETVLFAYDYSLRSRNASCKLTSYWRKRGDARLAVQRARPSFEMHFASTGDGLEDYQVVFRRGPDCDPASAAFIAGSVSWPAPPAVAEIGLAEAAEGDALSASGAAARLVRTSRASLERFISCTFQRASHEADCAKPEFIELENAQN